MRFEDWDVPYADNDKLLNDWVDDIERHMNWELFETQEDWLYMNGELGKGRFPQFKSEFEVYKAFKKAFDSQITWLFCYLMEKMVRKYRLNNIDLGEDMEWYLRETMGDEEFEEWEKEAKNRIFKEYAEIIGEEKAKEIFDEAWGEY